jgi:hypothetical protein
MEEQTISPAVLELAKKLMAKDAEKASKRVEDLTRKYPHAEINTLRVLPHGTSGQTAYAVDITCTVCGKTHGPVFTSDLFQKKTCPDCYKTEKAAKKAEKKAQIDEVKAYLAEKAKAEAKGS